MERTAIEISEADYQVARDFLTSKTGLQFQENKREELMTVLQDRLAVLPRVRSMGEYLASLRQEADGGRELRHLVRRLTVGETYFFRNHGQFGVLRSHIIPAIIQRKRGKTQRIRIWSAGCSTGEEAYSLAILLRELLPDLERWEVWILASDINEDALEAAREGVYRNWSFREVEEHYRGYFLVEGEVSRIRPEIRDMVTFRYLNLADDLYPSAVTGTDALDLILCRNVMIYFSRVLSAEITRRFFQSLEPDGCLVVGHSEHSDLVYAGFSRTFFGRTIVYRKSGPGPVWEKGLAIRFRGSGPSAPDLLTHAPPGAAKGAKQRPPGTDETVIFERAVLWASELRTADAVAEFKRVLEINPRNERALYSIAMLLANAGDNAGAAAWAERLIEVNPLHLEATYLLAIVAREAGVRERELSLLKKTVYLNPDFVLGHFQMGVHYLRVGNERLARRSLLNVLALLREKPAGDRVEGVEGMTVGRLREAANGLLPGGPRPAGERHGG
jgi:chemotaxis protein methyltransferase CheR